MKKKILVLVAATIFASSSCFGHGSIPLAQRYAMQAITVGNSTVIPLCANDKYNLTIDNLSNLGIVLEVKEAYRDMHPELQITNTHETVTDGKILFIWIDHKPRKKK